MFTGIIEETGKIQSFKRRSDSIALTIQACKVLTDTQLGDSIAVNGVCLTVTSLTTDTFTADVMHETMRRSSLQTIGSGDTVNLERAVAVGGRLGGHLVSGHIDGTGHIMRIQPDGIANIFTISAAANLVHFIVEKGSVALDGVSLTVTAVGDRWFSVSLIPHTLAHTTLLSKKTGEVLNIETDIIGKYIDRLMHEKKDTVSNTGGLTLATLREQGF